VPYWRQGDIEIPDDLVEEIARIYGYHNLPATLPKGDIPSRPCLPCLPAGRPDRQAAGDYFNNEERTKDFISDLGFCEVYSNSMVSEKMLENFGINPASALKIKNPLNEDMVYMRSTLIPSLLKIISKNLRHKKEAGIFEMANIYLLREGREKSRLPKEEMTLTLAISGPGDKAFGKLRAVSESLFKKLCIKEKDVVFAPAVRENLHPTRTAVIKIGGAEIGIVGELHPCLAGRQVATFKALDIGQRVAVAEISFEKLEAFASDKKIYTPVSKFPPVEMDLAIVLDKKINWSDIEGEISNINPLIADIEIFDIYEGKNLPMGKKSLAFHIVLQSFERTLQEEEVKKITGQIIEKLKNKFGAELRK
ncbi:hypothetical protein KKA96_04630, partial [Patescibacteria group bacterium]|nr:hypothetical protein [Patescibacteria group bacterium]